MSMHLIRLQILICLVPSIGLAASIAIFSDSNCGSCNLAIGNNETVSAVVAVTDLSGLPAGVEGVLGAEFSISGLPPGWVGTATANPTANVAFGDPFVEGAFVSFPLGQTPPCILLYTISITATSSVQDVVLSINAKDPPTSPLSNCPAIIPSCDGLCPDSPPLCVEGGVLFINSTKNCVVSIESSTWETIKRLYR